MPALATGNCVVFKPSDLAPAVGEWLWRTFRDAGLPPGCFELVQGRAETGRALALHEDVNGVLFTGSHAVGRALEEATLDQPGKLLALELGGKNGMIVWEDADLPLALSEAALSIAATTGQRCSSLSRIFVARPRIEEFQDRLAKLLGGLVIGPPLEPGVFMGPLVSRAAFERVMRCARAVRAPPAASACSTARSTASRRSSRRASCASRSSTSPIPISARRCSGRRPRSTRWTTSTRRSPP